MVIFPMKSLWVIPWFSLLIHIFSEKNPLHPITARLRGGVEALAPERIEALRQAVQLA